MHIAEGILPLSVTIPSYAVTAAATAFCLHKIDKDGDPREHIPKAALLAAAFFTISTISIPVPPASVHLILGGLMGVMLGYYAIPAILVALFFQAVMFGHGGITTLGVNGIVLAIPALIASLFFSLHKPKEDTPMSTSAIMGFAAGVIGAGISVGLFVMFLISFIPAHVDPVAERASTFALAAAHIPVIIVEGIITAFIVVFLRRSNPSLLAGL